ncbi:beta-glucanase precursor, putative [Trichomonas vaginalis G3]|uniref:Beta-glucanase, putative n=1 Tax=Trichomonas vaginalis (strain ATCC PRA-98 / G3) TaxID=412133 RepID=A2FJL7_TRIV3|nr:glycosyl hydrolases family 43 [Trichomonas vaginalis G3]EAX94904.1 beta-glucanase precursor, putative [Trichomonas vaginalis G3]KAI5482414.1 glycosyl hydrolases family 43 [Trichomonas vaginalis G3]|eukprot:XP_001307834.1 beta-glucanase precursor [Trichomonas vaginalis G3]
MDWDERAIKLYLDDELLNCVLLSRTLNPAGSPVMNPFKAPQFLILNLALGATGGPIDDKDFPRRYYIDYVRVQQMKKYMKEQ